MTRSDAIAGVTLVGSLAGLGTLLGLIAWQLSPVLAVVVVAWALVLIRYCVLALRVTA